jgi:hypothetical protein
VLGLGMGFSNTTFVIATQTSVGWSERGAATSANMFLRTVGQSVGTAIFGAMFNLGVGSRIAGADEEINRLLEPATRATVDAAEALRLSDAIAAAIHNVYLVAGRPCARAFRARLSYSSRVKSGAPAGPAGSAPVCGERLNVASRRLGAALKVSA